MENRKIKFRLWAATVGYFVYPPHFVHLITLSGQVYDTNARMVRTDLKPQQFTGHQDKNGKDIYEGDIVQVSKANCYLDGVYKVEWHPLGMWAYRQENKRFHDGWALKGNNQPYVVCQKNCEIIGNIYQNSELLEVN